MRQDESPAGSGSAHALLERYLKLVAFFLPRGERRDILAEIEGEIRAGWKEQEAELGRGMTEGEMEALLERWGHPLRIAGRYLPRRHLIGPEVFPLYSFTLKVIALVYLGPWLLVWLCNVLFSPVYRAAHPGLELLGTLSSFWSIAFFSFGSVTLAFALLERSFVRSGTLPAWNPRSELDRDVISRATSGFELVVCFTFLVWWLNPVPLPGFGPTGARDVWIALHARLLVPVLLLMLASVALSGFNWVHPRWTRARIAWRAALHGAWILLCAVVLVGFGDVGAQLEHMRAARSAGAEADALVAVAHLAVFAWFSVLAAAFAWSFAKDALRVSRWERAHLRAASCALVALALATFVPDLRAQATTGAHAQAGMPSAAEIDELLRDRIDVQRKSLCTVVGIVSPAGRRIVARGRLADGDERAPDGDTVFEIGSVTKVFTALLLAEMAQRGEVTLADPVARLLPDSVPLPEWQGRPIALVDLATHTSGLPMWPSNASPNADGNLPGYSELDLYDFLASHALAREPGAQWEYSNLGFGLLGHALALRAGKDYAELVRARITAPLGMESTAITLSPDVRARLAAGHDARLGPAPEWNVPLFPGAGSLRSTANDLLTFLAAAAGLVQTPLAPAFAAMLATRRPGPGLEQALGWWVIPFGPGDAGIVTHGGETHGYACTIAFDPASRAGAVVLSNSPANDGGLAWHVLRPAFPVATSAGAKERAGRAEVAVAPATLARLSGLYRTASGDDLTIELRDGALWFVSAAAPAGLRLHAASEREFFVREAELEIAFESGEMDGAQGMTVRFAGSDTRATRAADQTKEP